MERRVQTNPRPRKRHRLNLAYIFVLLIQIVCIVIMLALFVKLNKSESEPVETRIEDSMDVAYTKTGPIYTYVVGDPDYNHEYIITDRGGIVERDVD